MFPRLQCIDVASFLKDISVWSALEYSLGRVHQCSAGIDVHLNVEVDSCVTTSMVIRMEMITMVRSNYLLLLINLLKKNQLTETDLKKKESFHGSVQTNL